ncbi:hypothetical protein ABZ916_39455 [Streptomyces sp. NPDC046853]|uniref:hypothetical protein n=1 Tax=Streptomyces sp. NPDC046853 TaxID=3154920 RepID=UPI0033D6DD17
MQNMDRASLLRLIDDIRASVATGDSLEGNIQYLLADGDAEHPYDVAATYRIGNRAGQGGCVVIGADVGPLACPKCHGVTGPFDAQTGRCEDCTEAVA